MTSSPGLLRLWLALAAAGAVVILLSFIGTGAEAGGAAAIVVATLLTARVDQRPDAALNWWRLLALGAVLAAIGVPVGLALETIGGLIAGFGAACALIGAAFGWR